MYTAQKFINCAPELSTSMTNIITSENLLTKEPYHYIRLPLLKKADIFTKPLGSGLFTEFCNKIFWDGKHEKMKIIMYCYLPMSEGVLHTQTGGSKTVSEASTEGVAWNILSQSGQVKYIFKRHSFFVIDVKY